MIITRGPCGAMDSADPCAYCLLENDHEGAHQMVYPAAPDVDMAAYAQGELPCESGLNQDGSDHKCTRSCVQRQLLAAQASHTALVAEVRQLVTQYQERAKVERSRAQKMKEPGGQMWHGGKASAFDETRSDIEYILEGK